MITSAFEVQQPSPSITYVRSSKHRLFFSILISFFIILPFVAEASNDGRVINIGAIIDVDSRIGKEERTALEIAVQSFNVNSNNHNLSLYIRDSRRNPFVSATAAEELIKEKDVKAIIGMETWEEAALVADIGSRARIPVLSFASPATPPKSAATRWPYLVRMATDDSEQMKCIAAIISSYGWRKVIAVYEDGVYGGDYGQAAELSEALQKSGSEIEHRLILPPFSSISNPKEVLEEELEKLQRIQSRVFVVLQASSPMTVHLFEEAKKMRFVGRDSVWIITDTISSYLDSYNSSVISSMEGALGIKTYYSEASSSYRGFYDQFRRIFRKEQPGEDNFEPGIQALKAYDSIRIITEVLEGITSPDINPEMLLKNILSINFNGLSGEIRFRNGQVLSQDPALRIINVVGQRYKELDFWLPRIGFTRNLEKRNESDHFVGNNSIDLIGRVTWPAELERVPKGWAMPTNAKPIKIGVPGRTQFQKFVKVEFGENPRKNKYGGFCIELFHEVLHHLDYELPYEFHPFNGSYSELVDRVYNKMYDAAVGDITILEERAKKVEFTQPYAESGLSMIVPVKSEESAWIFLKPFPPEMWLVTGAILIYTMSIVWFLERQSNPEFEGPWKTQMGTALWFTFSSIFFAHREKIYSNLTKVVVVVWLFVVMILTSSYTASLSSMLTVRRMEPNVTDISWLKNAKIGYDGDSFVKSYLKDVIGFKEKNIINVDDQHKYEEEFKSNNITAAFLELPYQKVFLSHYCNQYIPTTPISKFGGLAFAFQKGSPIAADFSRAFLKFFEGGSLKILEDRWFDPQCAVNVTETSTDSLSLHSFWGLYLISGGISTICFLLSIILSMRKYYRRGEETKYHSPLRYTAARSMAVVLAKHLSHRDVNVRGEASNFNQVPDNTQRSSSGWEYGSPPDSGMKTPVENSSAEIEIP
ncbi:hypothetical protein SLE2022_303870 [Rubroshorea leprosula]